MNKYPMPSKIIKCACAAIVVAVVAAALIFSSPQRQCVMVYGAYPIRDGLVYLFKTDLGDIVADCQGTWAYYTISEYRLDITDSCIINELWLYWENQ